MLIGVAAFGKAYILKLQTRKKPIFNPSIITRFNVSYNGNGVGFSSSDSR